MVYNGTTNDMKRSSVPAIAFNKSSDHGSHYFISIYTVKLIHSCQWSELPIDYDVISKLRYLAEREDANRMTDNYPMFEWSSGVLITGNVSE